MNPCPCGYLGDSSGRCGCTADQVQRYRARISGPILDRIDMHIEVPQVPKEMLYGDKPNTEESSATVRARVENARQRQQRRSGKANHQLNNREIEQHCALDNSKRTLLEQAIEKLGLSARASHRILRVARTIADLNGRDNIDTTHLSEAISYRRLDRNTGRPDA